MWCLPVHWPEGPAARELWVRPATRVRGPGKRNVRAGNSSSAALQVGRFLTEAGDVERLKPSEHSYSRKGQVHSSLGLARAFVDAPRHAFSFMRPGPVALHAWFAGYHCSVRILFPLPVRRRGSPRDDVALSRASRKVTDVQKHSPPHAIACCSADSPHSVNRLQQRQFGERERRVCKGWRCCFRFDRTARHRFCDRGTSE